MASLQRAQAAAAAAAATAAVPRAWSKAEVKALEEKLLAFAPGRWRPVRASLSSKMNKRGSKDIQHAGRGILLLIKLAAELGGISNKPAGPTRAMLEAEEKVKAKEETAAAAARAASKGSKKSASQSVVAAAPVAADAAAGGGGEEVDPEKALAAHAEHLEQLHARQAGEARTAVAMYADRVAKVLAEIKAGLKVRRLLITSGGGGKTHV